MPPFLAIIFLFTTKRSFFERLIAYVIGLACTKRENVIRSTCKLLNINVSDIRKRS